MIIISTLWILAGISSFFMALRAIWETLDEIFIVGWDILKVAAVVGMFLFHAMGGLISLYITVYNHFHGD